MWEEKIDLLKNNFSSQEFQVPFVDWSNILKKIESKFIIKENGMCPLTNWTSNVKNRQFSQSIDRSELSGMLEKLDECQTYWFVTVMGDAPTSKQYVYGCNPKTILCLSSISSNDFFIVEKKLTWLAYFRRTEHKIEIYKSGKAKTPFDKAVLH